MLEDKDFYSFKDFITVFNEEVGEDIDANDMYDRIKTGKTTPYLDYKGAVHLTKNGVVLDGIDYAAHLYEEDFYISAIFKLSYESVILSEFGLEAILGVGKPVAHIRRLYETNNKKLVNTDTIGYCLYNKLAKINKKYEKSSLKCELIFKSEELLDIISEHIDKQRSLKLKTKLTEAEKTIEDMNRTNNLLEIKNDRLENKLKAHKNNSTNDSTRIQDYKVIAMMALLISEKSTAYKRGEKPNSERIKNEILRLADDLNIHDTHRVGLKASNKRIAKCLDQYLEEFFIINPK